MGLFNKLPEHITEVDVIVAGGGAAGCIVAGRLAEADPRLSVLVIESGPNNQGDPMITFPAFFITHMDPNDKYVLAHRSKPLDGLGGREPIVTTSRVLGGGSSINLGLYSRPQRSEIDAWDAPGWSATDMLRYMNKVENFNGPGLKEHHGHDGPMYVGQGSYPGNTVENDFVRAVKQAGWPEIEDINCLDKTNGVMRGMHYVDPNGTRQDVAHSYLHPKLASDEFPNLHVLVETDVERVLFDDDKNAIGVTFKPCPAWQPGTEDVPTRSVKARKRVVLSAGALGTPLILERSGIGRPEVLEKAGVPVVSSLPAVGENLHDHHALVYAYKSTATPEETADRLFNGSSNVPELIAKKDPVLSWTAVDAQLKIRPSEADVVQLGPAFEAAWNEHFKPFPDKPTNIGCILSGFPGDSSAQPRGQYLGFVTFSAHPFSRGRIHISGPKISDEADFDAGYWADKDEIDLKFQVWMYKKQREILRRMDKFNGEVAGFHPDFPVGSKAALVDGKVSSLEEIEYGPEDDKAIEKFLRAQVNTCWHSLGTCKMAPLEHGGAVDTETNVHGVTRLKVADLSIVPSNVGANTCSTAMAIGERAAEIIIGELGLAK